MLLVRQGSLRRDCIRPAAIGTSSFWKGRRPCHSNPGLLIVAFQLRALGFARVPGAVGVRGRRSRRQHPTSSADAATAASANRDGRRTDGLAQFSSDKAGKLWPHGEAHAATAIQYVEQHCLRGFHDRRLDDTSTMIQRTMSSMRRQGCFLLGSRPLESRAMETRGRLTSICLRGDVTTILLAATTSNISVNVSRRLASRQTAAPKRNYSRTILRVTPRLRIRHWGTSSSRPRSITTSAIPTWQWANGRGRSST